MLLLWLMLFCVVLNVCCLKNCCLRFYIFYSVWWKWCWMNWMLFVIGCCCWVGKLFVKKLFCFCKCWCGGLRLVVWIFCRLFYCWCGMKWWIFLDWCWKWLVVSYCCLRKMVLFSLWIGGILRFWMLWCCRM